MDISWLMSFVNMRVAYVSASFIMYGNNNLHFSAHLGSGEPEVRFERAISRLDLHPQHRRVVQRPACRDHRCGVYGAKAECPMCRASGLCRIRLPISESTPSTRLGERKGYAI